MKKLFASLFVAGLLLSGVVGCGSSSTTGDKKADAPDPKKAAEKVVTDAKAALTKAKDVAKEAKDDKKKDADEAVKKAEKVVEDAEEALKKIK